MSLDSRPDPPPLAPGQRRRHGSRRLRAVSRGRWRRCGLRAGTNDRTTTSARRTSQTCTAPSDQEA